MKYNLNIIAKVWDKETNCLFDYESPEHIISKLSVGQNCAIVKRENKLVQTHIVNDRQLVTMFSKWSNSEYLGKVSASEDMYDINVKNMNEESDEPALEDKPWIVVRHTFHEHRYGYKIKENDILKFGKIIFKVREIKIQETGKQLINKLKEKQQITYYQHDNTHTDMQNNQFEGGTINIFRRGMASSITNLNAVTNQIRGRNGQLPTNIGMTNNSEEGNSNVLSPLVIKQNLSRKRGNVPLCRICLCEDYDSANPLITPCGCSGTMKYIHLMCLRQYFKSKIVTKVFNFLIAHSYKTFTCDLCKKSIPEKIKVQNEVHSLIDLQKPENNYLVLESISKERNEAKYIYIIHMNDRSSVKIGRASDADVRITDISVSRNHAELKLLNDNFYLSDSSSKFGTLVRTKYNFVVIPNKQLAVQLRRSFLIFKMTRTFTSFLTCYNPKNLLFTDYNDFFEQMRMDDEKEAEVEVTEVVKIYDSNVVGVDESELKNEISNSNCLENNNNCHEDQKSKKNLHTNREESIDNKDEQDNNPKILEKCKSQRTDDRLISIANLEDIPNKEGKQETKIIMKNNNTVINNPSYQLNININLCDPNNNLIPIYAEKRPNTDDLETEVKNLVDNIFLFQNTNLNEQTPENEQKLIKHANTNICTQSNLLKDIVEEIKENLYEQSEVIEPFKSAFKAEQTKPRIRLKNILEENIEKETPNRALRKTMTSRGLDLFSPRKNNLK